MTHARAAAIAAAAAAASWLAVWWHQRQAHGPTSLNEEKVVLGLTWMDSGKLLVVPFLLVLVAVAAFFGPLRNGGWLRRLGFGGSVTALVALAVGTALQFWGFDWGSYDDSFEEASIGAGGALQAAATLLLAAALTALAVSAARRRSLPGWAVPVLPLSALATFWLTPTTFVPAVGWLVFAAVAAVSPAGRRG